MAGRSRSAMALVAVLGAANPGIALALDPDKSLSQCTVDTWNFRNGVTGWVRAFAQTSEGYLWVGTNTGLVRYGGGRMVPALAEAEVASRATDVMGLFTARDGTLWVRTARGGPLCMRGGPLRECLPEGARLDPSVRVSDLKEDPAGGIWLLTDQGIHRAHAGTRTLVYPRSALPEPEIVAIHPAADGTLWLGTTHGLYTAKDGTIAPHTRTEPVGYVAAFAPSRAGDPWVVTGRGVSSLLSLQNGQATLQAPSELPATWPTRPTVAIEDHDGNVWFGSREGLTRFRPGQGYLTYDRADGLPEEDVTTVFEDREGSLWVGTRGGGIAQFTDRTLDGQAGPPVVRDRWISALAEDDAGALWVATRFGLVHWRNGQQRVFTSADGLPTDEVLTVHPGTGGEVWVGTRAGLSRWRDGVFDRPALLHRPVTALYRDPHGVLWIGSTDALARLEAGHLVQVPPAPGVVLTEIRGMQLDDRGTLWLSSGGRLLRVADGQVTSPPPAAPRFGKVRSLHRDRDGTLWLGTYEGLVRLRHGQWRLIGPADGLASGDVFQVLTDDHGYLWAGSTRGILRVSRRSIDELADGRRSRLEVVSFQSSDRGRAVGALRPRQPGAWKSRDGRLWFATSRGLVRVDPHRLRVNQVPPTVLIEQALVGGRPAHRDRPNDLPPGARSLELHFSAITLIEPHKALHRYRLEGFDADWVDAGTRRSAYYTNLPPGRYRFRVQGSNADGIWNERGDALAFSLAPRFYQTVWFYLLGLGALVGLLVGAHRLRVVHLKGRYAAIFAERTRVARELHDSLLQGMSASLLHVKALRKRLARTAAPPAPGAVGTELEAIEGLIVSTMDDTRRFVMGLREEPAPPVDLGAALEEMTKSFRAKSGVDVSVSVEANGPPLPHAMAQDVLRIAREALVNAAKHARPSRIEVRLARVDGRPVLSIRDDGAGFDLEKVGGAKSGHFGLVGMRERAAAIGALRVESRPGQGTTVHVTIDPSGHT